MNIVKEILSVAKELTSEVEEVEEIEPQGSKPVKERRKEADDFKKKEMKMAKELLSELEDVKSVLDKAIAELKKASSGKQVTYGDVAGFVHNYLADGKYHSDATKYFFS